MFGSLRMGPYSRATWHYRPAMEIERGLAGKIPYAAVGTGEPILVFCGLWPITGVANDRLVRGAVAPLAKVVDRQLVVFNRRSNMSAGFMMGDIAAEYADAMESGFGSPLDVLGVSTGGALLSRWRRSIRGRCDGSC